jgi:hypothetical protein
MLREMAEYSGLVSGVTGALIGTYSGLPFHLPGRVFSDLAVAVADGADCISGIAVLADRQGLFGPVASVPTAWRVLDRISQQRLGLVAQARAAARARVWEAGGAPNLDQELCLDFDGTITIAHSDKQDAAPTFKKTYGFHPLLCFLDRPEIANGEALAGLLRPGNAGSNTAQDHITVLEQALAALPPQAKPVKDTETGRWSGPRLLARSDTAGATHKFAQACVDRGVGFSFGFAVDRRVQQAVDQIPQEFWRPAVDTDGKVRQGAWVTEATDMINLDSWPVGSRLILRKERPHPGAQLTFTDKDGMRVTAFLTNTPTGTLPSLELRHRQHTRVEDRIRQAKATGLRNLPCKDFAENAAWLEIVMAANDLIAWTKLIAFQDAPDLACCEIAAFRYRVLHVAARITTSARQIHLRIDKTWRWATQTAQAYQRIRTAFT